MNIKIFSGVHTALITPFNKEGKVAFDEVEQLVEAQIRDGISGIVAVGTTGESPTLDHSEHIAVVECVVKTAAGRVPVIAGTGSNSTDEAVALTRQAEAVGADGMLVVTPYYNKPSQQGLLLHMSAIASATDRPIILYSIPGRCVIEFGLDTIARMHESHPHILGIKESGGSCDRVEEMVRTMGDDFIVVSGDDSMTLPFMSVGAQGVISVASNLLAADFAKMVSHALNNDFAAARAVFHRYAAFCRDIFLDPNPVPIKYALAASGMISCPAVRLPLAPLSDSTRAIIDRHLKSFE